MEARRLLIAEDNEEIRLALSRKLQVFHYVRCCATGTEALEILRREKPDMLILNMLLPEIDGLTLLERISAEGIRPMVLALTAYRSDYLEHAAYRLGVSCILMRPAPLEHIVDRALDMKDYLKTLPPKRTPELIAREFLAALRIPPTCSGYPVLRQAMLLSAEEPESFLCKQILPDTARLCNISVNAADSRIRRTVEKYWDAEIWSQYFPGLTRRPSTAAFLQQFLLVCRREME